MNRITRAVVCAVPAVLGQLLVVAPAFADSGQSKPLQTAWYWYRASDAFPLQPAPAVVPPSDPSTPDGGLPVSPNPNVNQAAPERMIKESYVSFDISAVPATATINSFKMTAPVVADYTQQSEVPKVVACLPPRAWTAGTALAWSDKPFVDCGTGKAAGSYDDASKTWTFDLTTFAQGWLGGGNVGIALTNDPEYTGKPYQVVFDAAKIKAEVTWTPAAPVVSQPVPQVPQPQVAPPPMPVGSSGSLSSGSVGGTTYVPPVAPPVVQPAPQVANGPVTQPVALAAVPLRVGGAPGAGFWVLGLCLAGLLVLASWILGDTSEPVAVRTGDNRLDRALRARRLGGSAGAGARASSARGSLTIRPV